MTKMKMEMRLDGSIVVSWGSRVYVSPSDRPRRNWYEDGPRGAQRVSERRRRRLERLRRDRAADLHIHRFPRLPVSFKLGQLVHHTEFGTGTISSFHGCNVTVTFCDAERELDFEQVVTRALAEERWQDCYSHGANRRLEEGRWLWVVRSLCSRRGEWTAFLEKWGVPRSSAHDLIQRFLQERLWESQHSSGNRTEGVPKFDEGATDDAKLNAERERVVRIERAKREGNGHDQTAKLTDWHVRIKLPEAVAEDCREKYKEDYSKEYWVRAAYRFADREDELESGSDAEQENGSWDE